MLSRRPLTGDPESPTVSMTTYGARASRVHLAVESIGRGRRRPGRLILWVDDPDLYSHPPRGVSRAMQRGVELMLTENRGPHTKYYPTVQAGVGQGVSLVTADDDILYPRRWLGALCRASQESPGAVIAFRAHWITTTEGALDAYASWPSCPIETPSRRVFATGVSGVLYPPDMLDAIAQRGDEFMAVSRRNDDIWLHWVALRAGVAVRQVGPRSEHFPIVPRSQQSGLLLKNLGQSFNDQIIAELYAPEDVALIDEHPA
ncbi:hypothetical protein ASD18_17680 [Cellulomonas sp. Root137]|nr:hypothetical protein ASD18_17680 [Cellulomonas sp. Root137]